MGTKDYTFVQLNQLIGRKTGGISVYPFTSSIRGQEEPCSHVIVRGKAMAGRAEDLFNLVLLAVVLVIRHCVIVNAALCAYGMNESKIFRIAFMSLSIQ